MMKDESKRKRTKKQIKDDEEVKLDFGTGLMMVCTFGDGEDVKKWKRDKLDTRLVIGKDGLSGWNLIVLPHGRGQISARLERYDRLVYQTERLPLPEAEESRLLTASLANERFTASLDGLLLFDAVPVNSIPGHHRIGIATWGDDPAIERIDLSRPR